MNTDPAQIRADIEGILADLPRIGTEAGNSAAATANTVDPVDTVDPAHPADADRIDNIDAVGRRLEQAHQILVNALESVEKG